MIIKQRLFSLLIAGFTVITGQAMNFDEFSQIPCKTCDQVKLNDFWTKAKNDEIDPKTIKKHLESELLNNEEKSYEDCSDTLQQAICSGKIDFSYQPGLTYSNEYYYSNENDLVGLAIEKEDLQLLDICLEQGYSPNNPITVGKEKKSILDAINSKYPSYYNKLNLNLCLQMWSRLKKYNADFNMPIGDKKETLLHYLVRDSNAPEKAFLIQWLLKETNLDINKPNVDGNTAGHDIAYYCTVQHYKTNEAAFDVLTNNNFNPLQRNNYGQTTADMIYPHMKTGYNHHDKEMIKLWKECETEYKLNNPDYATNQKCYNQISTINLTITPEEAQKAYGFFPQDSTIGTFCKHNPFNQDCLQLAELFTAANTALHAIVTGNHILDSCSNYDKEETDLRKKISSITDNISKKINNRTLTNKELNLLDPETREQLANIEQLDFEKRHFLREKIINTIGDIPLLENMLNAIIQKHQIASKKYTKVSIKAQDSLKRIEGNYQPLYFDHCQDSWYHKSVKNLLKKVITNPFYTKQLHQNKEIDVLTPEVEEECLKISEALYNARYNKNRE